jgi:predicted metal-dependent hydrolase
MAASDPADGCSRNIHPRARDGIALFNRGEYFEAHEALEDAWKEEKNDVRDLYRGILQIAVTYLHITRGNYNGAVKVYDRSKKWMRDWPDLCQGIAVGKLRQDAEKAMAEVYRLGADKINQFNSSLLKPIELTPEIDKLNYLCDRCGHEMYEKNCKVTCPNCGNRFDCSDLNIYFD